MKIDIIELLRAETLIFLCIAPFLIIAAIILVKLGKSLLKREREQEKEYERLYNKIKSFMDNDIIFYSHKEFVWSQITILKNLPYKNPEKTQVLWNSYMLKLKQLNASIS